MPVCICTCHGSLETPFPSFFNALLHIFQGLSQRLWILSCFHQSFFNPLPPQLPHRKESLPSVLCSIVPAIGTIPNFPKLIKFFFLAFTWFPTPVKFYFLWSKNNVLHISFFWNIMTVYQRFGIVWLMLDALLTVKKVNNYEWMCLLELSESIMGCSRKQTYLFPSVHAEIDRGLEMTTWSEQGPSYMNDMCILTRCFPFRMSSPEGRHLQS